MVSDKQPKREHMNKYIWLQVYAGAKLDAANYLSLSGCTAAISGI